MKSRFDLLLVALVCGLLVLSGCDNGTGTSGSGSGSGSSNSSDDGSSDSSNEANTDGLADLEGEVNIDGSSTVAPITMSAAESFAKRCPKVKVPVGISGTGGGFKRFTVGDTDISDASRPIKDKERAIAAENSIKFYEIPVAYDGLTIVVNKECDWTDQITVDQLKQIFHADSAAKKWSDVDSSWPDEEIKIFAPGTDSGTFDYFKEVIAKEGSIRGDMSVSEDDHVIVQGVSQNKTAIGFFGAAYYFENKAKLKALAVVNPESSEAVLPSDETIENGTYAPFSRPLFIYVNSESAKKAEVKVFIDHYLKNAAAIAKEVGYVGLPKDVYEQAATNLKQRKTGTHYLTKDGEKRHGALTEIFKPENLN